MSIELEAPGVERQVLRETWLTRRPRAGADLVVMLSFVVLGLGSVLYWMNPHGLGDLMPGNPDQVFTKHEYWRLWTALLAHADTRHLFSNGLFFFIFGYLLNGYYGLWIFPIGALMAGALVNAIALATYRPEVLLLGSSGAVCWMGAVWLTLYFFIHRLRSPWRRGLLVSGISLMLFAPAEAFDPSVSYRAHLIGFGLGVLMGLLIFMFGKARFRAAEYYETVVD
jgi:rhomboid protease GluP